MTDPDLTRRLREVVAADDEARADYERWDYEFQKKLKQRSAGSEPQLVYKTVPSERQQHTATMDPATEARWSLWADAKIDRALLKFFTGHLKETMGAVISELRREWQNEIKKAIADFKLPVIEGWQPRHYLKGSVVISGGGTYQAQTDTAFPPGHHTWACLAAPGERGEDGLGIGELNARLEKRLADFELKINALIVDRALGDKVVDLPNWPRKQNAG